MLRKLRIIINGKPFAFTKLINEKGYEKIIWFKKLNQLLNKKPTKKRDKIIIKDDIKFIIINNE